MGWERLDALARNLPRVALAEQEQRHVVRRAHSEGLEGWGGAAEGDERGEVAVLVGDGELVQERRDSGVVVAKDSTVEGSNAVAVLSEQGWVVVTDQELDGGGIRWNSAM